MLTKQTKNAARSGAEREVLAELSAWCEQAAPDAVAPLDADDLVTLIRDCIGVLGLDPEIASGFTVNTVHYYRRKEIIDAPHGRTAAARYDRHHLWQIVGARLAGHLGLVTLAEARDAFRDAGEQELRAFVAARVVDARARNAVRSPVEAARETPRPLPGVHAAASMIALPGGAICVIPAEHYARHSRKAARQLVTALARALDVSDIA